MVVILQSSLYCIGYLKIKKNLVLEFLTFLMFCNEIILGGRILNMHEARFSKLVFHVVLSYYLPDILLQIIYIHLLYLLNYWI